MEECAFCQNEDIRERVIFENELAFAFPTHTPIVVGHTLVCPKRHLTYYEELTVAEMAAIEELRYKLKLAMQTHLLAEGFNYAWNEEVIGGQSVPHFHLHVVPRKQDDVGVYGYEPREFLYRPGPRREITQNEELIQITEILQNKKAG